MTMENKDMVAMFLKEKPVKALVEIVRADARNTSVYGSKISRKVDTTYAHTVKTLQKLEDQGFVESEKQGRKKLLTPTEKGREYGMAWRLTSF